MLISYRFCDFECAGHPVWTLVGRSVSEWVIKVFERLNECKNRAVLQRFDSFRFVGTIIASIFSCLSLNRTRAHRKSVAWDHCPELKTAISHAR